MNPQDRPCARSWRSGTNDADVLRLATARYQDDGHKGKVPIDLWRILSRSQKWQQLNNSDGGSSKKRSSVDAEVKVDDTIGSSEQRPPFNVADPDDEEPIPRPIGRKKAKSIALGFYRKEKKKDNGGLHCVDIYFEAIVISLIRGRDILQLIEVLGLGTVSS
ncbi:unnamed protein product [Cuscuta campestris]|uniref:No apical meristem-associated C-terminal domain-containing protein n=1 Tax=Cuscuta campestris TaxID=132261 RepID=A0A484KNI9_9ASTE|nr:unnamed protein product [Cuscuta campestris]